MSIQIAIDFDAGPRERGIQSSLDRANRSESEWSGQALGLLIAYAAKHYPDAFLVEDARVWAESVGLPAPPNNKAWGGVTLRARGKGRIQNTDTYGIGKTNKSPKPLWRYVAASTPQGEPK